MTLAIQTILTFRATDYMILELEIVFKIYLIKYQIVIINVSYIKAKIFK